MVGHLLGHLEPSAFSQILRDPGCAEALARDLCVDAGLNGAPADHSVYVPLGHGKVRDRAASPAGCAAEVLCQKSRFLAQKKLIPVFQWLLLAGQRR